MVTISTPQLLRGSNNSIKDTIMTTNIINFNTATKSLNDAKFEADVLAKIHESSPKRWWMVRREPHQFDVNSIIPIP
jgi:hypothetical protein